MKMMMSVLSASCALSAVPVCAQPLPVQRLSPSVTIYGIIDSGVERITNVGPARNSLVRVPSLASSTSPRLGYRGAEDLGGGLWAQFVLETGIDIGTGGINQGGRFFGRQAFVGLTGDWGSVSLGRQYDMLGFALADYGVLGPNAYSIGSLDPYLSAARFDNSISYLGQFGPVGVGANYSLGRDVVGGCAGENPTDAQACRAYSVMAKYVQPSWGVVAGYDVQKGGVGAAAGLTTSHRKDTRWTVNGFFRQGPWKIGGGLIHRVNDGAPLQPKSNLYFVEGAYAVTPAFSLEGFVGQLRYENSPTRDRATHYALRGMYSLSKRTAVYTTVGRTNNRGASALSVSGTGPGSNPLPGVGQTGILVGVRTSF